MLRVPPVSTFFPYTTLFRSPHVTARVLRRRHDVGEPRRRAPRPARLPRAPLIDRKSTRLNSSHVAISYAVFCLKKKKTCTEGVADFSQQALVRRLLHYNS